MLQEAGISFVFPPAFPEGARQRSYPGPLPVAVWVQLLRGKDPGSATRARVSGRDGGCGVQWKPASAIVQRQPTGRTTSTVALSWWGSRKASTARMMAVATAAAPSFA